MKRWLWSGLMALSVAGILAFGSRPAAAFTQCDEQSCTLNNDCVVTCPPCTGDPGNPGVCDYE